MSIMLLLNPDQQALYLNYLRKRALAVIEEKEKNVRNRITLSTIPSPSFIKQAVEPKPSAILIEVEVIEVAPAPPSVGLDKAKIDEEKVKEELAKELAFDSQGRILIDVEVINFEELAKILKVEVEKLKNANKQSKTTVSLDIHSEDIEKTGINLQELFYLKLKKVLPSPHQEKIIISLQKLPKGSIIPLQQEFHFHLSLAMRVYQKAIADLGNYNPLELEKAHENAALRVNRLILTTYAQALNNAYNEKTGINLALLNKELDEARAKLINEAHSILREEIIAKTKIELNQKALDEAVVPLKKIAKTTTASGNDVVHFNNETGLCTWIQGSNTASHDRGVGESHLAPRQLITHPFQKKQVTQNPLNRLQIRTPSLDAKPKNKFSQLDLIADVKAKLNIIVNNYPFTSQVSEQQPTAFVYNLYTSLFHWWDDSFTKNRQTEGANILLLGAHFYNQGKREHPFCFIQNIPINSYGSSLSANKPLVQEAKIMSEMAFIYTLADSSNGADKQKINNVINLYQQFLKNFDPINPQYFYSSAEGKKAQAIILEIKSSWKQEVSVKPANVVDAASACLKQMVANNLHLEHEYATLIQTLSVFLEKESINGCKSANERTQAINGRVAMLDALSLYPNKNEYSDLYNALKNFDNQKIKASAAQLKQELDLIYNQYGLQTAPSLISSIDQGAASKVEVKSGLNTNKFENSILSFLFQANAGAMQAHKKLVEFMKAACAAPLPHTSHKKNKLKLEKRTEENTDLEDQGANWLEKLGIYQEREPAQDQEFASKLLKSTAAKQELYKGIGSYQKKHLTEIQKFTKKHGYDSISTNDPSYFRKKFIDYLHNKELPAYLVGEPDLRKDKPELATIEMEDLLGEEGTELYHLALEEERFSEEYMNAVFYSSSTYYKGEKWAERPVVVVAGPSACGKTVAAQEAVKKADKLLPKIENNNEGNYVVASDGGEARDRSKIRRMVTRMANYKGYTGIKDLHEQSDILEDVKGCVLKAAYKTPDLGIVIPETFSGVKKIFTLLNDISKLKNSRLVFAEVVGKYSSIFQKVVNFMGNRRAWATDNFGKLFPDIENKEGLKESKAYGPMGFFAGVIFSGIAKKRAETFPNTISLTITNDLILLRKVKPDSEEKKLSKEQQWVPGNNGEEGLLLISERIYQEWLNTKEDKDLETFNKEKGWPPTLIETTGELAITKVKANLEARKNHLEKKGSSSRKQEKINQLQTAILILEKLDVNDVHAVRKAYNNLNNTLLDVQRGGKKVSATHKTLGVFHESLSALKTRYKELKIKDEPKNEARFNTLQEIKAKHQQTLATADKELNAVKPLNQQLKTVLENSFTWLNPAFQASAKTAANNMLSHLKELQDNCEKIGEKLTTLRDQFSESISALTSQKAEDDLDPLNQEIDKHLTVLENKLQQIDTEQVTLQNAQGKLSELADSMDKALKEEDTIQITSVFTSTIEDVGQEEHFSNIEESQVPKVSATTLEANNEEHAFRAVKKFEPVKKIEEGKKRRHLIADESGNPIGAFSEEHIKKPEDKTNPETIKLTMEQFPHRKATEDKIIFSFAMAMQLLAGLEGPPTVNKPLVLKGSNKEEIRFLWTALMVIGENTPHMKFSPNAVDVNSRVFDPSKELSMFCNIKGGLFSRFASDSCYSKHFKNSTTLKKLIRDVKQLSEAKFGAQKDTEKAFSQLTKFFREKLNDLQDKPPKPKIELK